MKSLISINFKFMELGHKELVELITASKHTKGVEAYIEYDSIEEIKYCL